MPLEKITEAQMDAQGVCAAPDILNGTPAANKAVFDRLVRQVVVTAYNSLIDQLTAMGVEQAVRVPEGAGFKYLRLNSNLVLEVSEDGETWRTTGSQIVDGDGNELGYGAYVSAEDRERWDGKPDQMEGDPGQIVGFDAAGKPAATDMPARLNQENLLSDETASHLVHMIQTAGGLPSVAVPTSSAKYYGKGKFFLKNSGNNVTSKSEDGITWETTSSGSTVILGREVVYANNKFYSWRADSSTTSWREILYTSEDGETWAAPLVNTVTKDTILGFTSFAYGNGIFVAVGGGSASATAPYLTNKAMRSTDGASWSKITLPVSAYWQAIRFLNGKFYAIGRSAYSPSTGMTELDTLLYSEDGLNWTQTQLPFQGMWTDITYGNGVFIATAFYDYTVSTATPTRVGYSTDGITWTTKNVPGYATGPIIFTGEYFILTGKYGKTAFFSKDGIFWSTHLTGKTYSIDYSTSGGFTALSSGDGRDIWVGNAGVLCFDFSAPPTTVDEALGTLVENIGMLSATVMESL